MIDGLIRVDNYAGNLHALPTAAAAALVIAVSIVTLVRESRSPAARPFALIAAAMLVWMVGSTMMYLSAVLAVADFWSRFGTMGVAFTPAGAVFFTAGFVERRRWLKSLVAVCMAISGVFLVTGWVSPLHIGGVALRWWGYYPIYGPLGAWFMLYTGTVVALCLALLWQTWRRSRLDSIRFRRLRLLMAGIGVASLSSVDFIGTLGIPMYPVGFAPIVALFCVLAYVTRTYRLTDITPSLAGQRIIDTMTDALVVTDPAGTIRVVNPAACELLDASEAELLNTGFGTGRQLLRDTQTRVRLMGGETLRGVETCIVRGETGTTTLSVSASVLQEAGETIALIYVLRDISARKRAEERVRLLAFNDPLTGLPNRLSFDEHLASLLDEAGSGGGNVTVLCFDLDRFRRINDTLGHEAGDVLLRTVAGRLREFLHTPGIVALDGSRPLGGFLARLGGDEFALALDDVTQVMEIRRVAQGFLDLFASPVKIDGQEVHCSVSIGIAQYPRDGLNVHTLVKNADTAMYHAKDAGRSNFKFYNRAMTPVAVCRLDLEGDLRRALEHEQFEIEYQPQIDIRTGRIFGAEALLRWRHPERGTVSPAEFIPLAEETGLIVPIGEWVLREACRQTRVWHDAGFAGFKVAVNLSERQFRQNDLVMVVSRALDDSGLDPAALDLELTEGTIMRQAEDTVFALSEMKSMGVHISVDDFGTGYSSLGYLKRFPIDVIKIDRSFVKDITIDPDDAAITASIIAMARSLQRIVIAEGVETLQQAHALRDRGCNYMQGFLFGRPMGARSLQEVLTDNAAQANEAKVVQLA